MTIHSLLSASSAHRWLNCPPSVMLSMNYEDILTDYAMEGTAAHSLCEMKLKNAMGMKGSPLVMEYPEFFNPAMDGHTDGYVAFVLKKLERAKRYCCDPLLLIEERVDYSEYTPGARSWGTADALIVGSKVLTIVDMKYGSILVDATNNAQLMLYGLGAMAKYGMIYDFQTVELNIYQPRRENYSTWSIGTEALIQWGEHTVKPIAALALQGQGDAAAGKWCKFCKHQDNCKTFENQRNLNARDILKNFIIKGDIKNG